MDLQRNTIPHQPRPNFNINPQTPIPNHKQIPMCLHPPRRIHNILRHPLQSSRAPPAIQIIVSLRRHFGYRFAPVMTRAAVKPHSDRKRHAVRVSMRLNTQ